MKNRRGFTLIEMIGVVIIIGIIAIIAFNTFTGNLKGFRDDYYVSTERTLEESGKEFFNDNRRFRPDSILTAQKVSIGTLTKNNYVNNIDDYNGNSCSDESYVMIIKESKDEYTYHTCLVCPEDGYDNTKDQLCDPSWLDPSTISYGLRTLPTLYIYKGTSRDKLRELLTIPISIIKKNAKGEVLKEVRGDGIDDVPTILPKNIDVVNPDKIGTYKVEYEYTDAANEKQKQTTNVIVYENDAPRTNVTYENIVAADLNGTTSIESGTYLSGKWVQKITINFTASAIKDPESKVARYQWNKNGKWQDICTEVASNGSCTREITTEMNEVISFRTVDTKGNISTPSNPLTIKIDHTKPTCTLKKTGTMGKNNWYVSDVTVSFDVNNDLVPSNGDHNAISQVKISNITKMPGNLLRTSSNNNIVHSVDIANVEYRGYVEDKAGNFYVCQTNFKKDDTNPVCRIDLSGTVGENDWYTSNVGVSFGSHTDNLSGVAKYGIGSVDGSKTINHTRDTAGVTYTGHIIDNAGNTATCSNTFKKDATNPSCTIRLTGTIGDNDWYTTNVGVSFGSHTDNLSGVAQYGIGTLSGNKSLTHTADTTSQSYTGHIKDNAGNTSSCTATFKKDATPPVCTVTGAADLRCTDSNGVVSYYWGTNGNAARSSFTTITTTKDFKRTDKPNVAGTYYIKAYDVAGNRSSGASATYTAVTPPTGASNCNSLTYNGSSQTLARPVTGYSYRNNSGTDANIYTVTAVLDPRYVWSNKTLSDKSFSCSISKKNLNVSADNKSKTYLENNPTLTHSYRDNVSGETPGFTGALTTTATKNSDVGRYPIKQGTLKIVDNGIFKVSNYNYVFTEGTLTINKRTPVMECNVTPGLIYNGSSQTLGTATSDGPGRITYSNEKRTDAGSQTYTATVAETSNYTSNSIECTGSIAKKDATITCRSNSETYTGSTISLGNATVDSNGSISYSSNRQTYVGTYEYTVNAAETPNYNSATKKCSATISCASGYTAESGSNSRCYKTLTGTINANGGSYSGATPTCNKYYEDSSCSLTFPTTEPTRTGYTFKGWSTSSTASSGTAAGGSVSITGDTTFYATWKVNCKDGYTYQSDGTCKKTYTATSESYCTGGSWSKSDTFSSKNSCSSTSKPSDPKEGDKYIDCAYPVYKAYCKGETSSAVSGRTYSYDKTKICNKYCSGKTCTTIQGYGHRVYTYSCSSWGTRYKCPDGGTLDGSTCILIEYP